MELLPWPGAVLFVVSGVVLGRAWGRRLGLAIADVPASTLLRAAPALGLALLLCLLAVTMEAVYDLDGFLQWHWPDLVLVWTVPVCRAIIFATLALLVGLLVSQPSPRGVRAIPVGILALAVCLWFNGTGRPIEVGRPRIKAGVLLQSTGATCLPTSAANILRRAGYDVTEASMVVAMGTTDQGTSVAQAVYGLSRLGIDCPRDYVDRLRQVQAPAILVVELGGLDHAVAFMGWDGERAEIWDPCRGRRLLTESELRLYHWHGHAIEIHLPATRS